jgi:hypothetical protein
LQIASLHLRTSEVRAIPPTLKVSLSFGRSRAHDRADAPHALALATSGHAAVAPPISEINSRRFN